MFTVESEVLLSHFILKFDKSIIYSIIKKDSPAGLFFVKEDTAMEAGQEAIRAFGLAFEVRRGGTKSGYIPSLQNKSKTSLYADLRIRGFVAGLQLGIISHLTVVGGNEESLGVSRGEAICDMLIKDWGIDPKLVSWAESAPHTLGNIKVITEKCGKEGINPHDVWVVSNHYHLLRAGDVFWEAGMHPRLVPAEALMLLEDPTLEVYLKVRFGRGRHAKRCVGEIRGFKDRLAGRYKPLSS